MPKKHKRFGINIYKLCSCLGYTYDVIIYSGKQCHATAQITAAHGTVLKVVQRVEGLGHRIFVDNYFTSSAVLHDLFQHKMICV
jgi:nickel-dependent lactate racemase